MTPHTREVDFFSKIGSLRRAIPGRTPTPHRSHAQDSSVAAIFGSRPSSAASEILKSNAFGIHPSEESDVDGLVTKAPVLRDFGYADSFLPYAEEYADAVLLTAKGGPELLINTQKAYFEKYPANLPYGCSGPL